MLIVAVTAVTVAGCGKKGPPLAPLLQAPGRAMDVHARRVGETVYIQFTIPDANIDGTKPADLERVDVYGYTALETAEVRNLRDMTLVASVPVKKPPEPAKESKKKTQDRPSPPPVPEPGDAQGTLVTVIELLTPAVRQPIRLETKAVRTPPPVTTQWFDRPVSQPLAMRPSEPQPARFYVVYGVSRRGNRGGASPRPSITFDALPGVPQTPVVEVAETAVTVKWMMPASAQRPYQELGVAMTPPAVAAQPADASAVPATLPSTPKGLPTAISLFYNVYLVDHGAAASPQPTASSVSPGTRQVAVPLNEKPLDMLAFADDKFEFGTERCYRITALQPLGPPPAAGAQPIAMAESAPSTVVCTTPADTFPPPAPTALSAVASEGAVSLIWEGVSVTDLAGYVVMRGEARAGPAGMTPLFGAPIRETTYRDASARPGVRYLYAIVAVDSATPSNRSLMSNVVEEAAR